MASLRPFEPSQDAVSIEKTGDSISLYHGQRHRHVCHIDRQASGELTGHTSSCQGDHGKYLCILPTTHPLVKEHDGGVWFGAGGFPPWVTHGASLIFAQEEEVRCLSEL